MSYSKPAWTAGLRTRSTILVALVVVSAAVIGALGYQSLVPTSQSLARSASSAESPIAAEPLAPRLRNRLHGHDGALGVADGVVPAGVTVFDDETPAVANVDPALLDALRGAATDAAGDGVEFSVNSGWRSSEYQEQLLRKAVTRYGSKEEAARWVATPTTSAHVSGDAVDIGHHGATAWLSEHGARYGLCQIYSNESWHYELRPQAADHGCPLMYTDPTHDPRMQQ